jgi:lambda family phage portal protein
MANYEYQIIDGKWHHKTMRKPAPSRIRHRAFAAANQDRLTASFTGSALSPDEAIRRDLRKLRARSRQLCMDNDYAKKFLHMLQANVVGVNGIRLQARTTWPDGMADEEDNQVIEKAWAEWCRPRYCSANGRLSFRDSQRQFITAVARDGEVLVRHIRDNGRTFAFGYALQIIEADHLDENYNRHLANGNRIVMGVELNQFDRPVFYHLFTRHPGDNAYLWGGKHYEKVPASDIEHCFIVDRPGQNRGVPWMHTAIRRLNMLGGYEEAELVAARLGASKMGFYTSPDGSGAALVDELGAEGVDYDDHDLIQEAEPGLFETLPEGYGFQSFDPQHPTSAYGDFTKSVLRGAASGLNVAYNSLANDLEGVNFSSIRQGVLDEREQWRVLQGWMAEQFCAVVYENWLPMALATQKLPLPPDKMDKFKSVVWQPRGWDWVDPLKDSKAHETGIANGTQTRAEILAAKGKDLRETFEQLKYEQDLAAEYGLQINAGKQQDMSNDTDDTEND